MSNDIDIGEIISTGFGELIKKGENDDVKSQDFTKLWCDLSLLPIYRIEFIVNNSIHTQKGYNKNEAIIYGHLIRIFKMLCYQRRLVCERVMTTTLSSFFERIIIETNINLQYFIINYQDDLLNDFRIYSLKAETFFQKIINDDIENNGGNVSSWQTNLLKSISNTYDKAESSYEEVRKAKVKPPKISDKFVATGNQKLYDIGYRIKCHDIHGDWVDLTQNYLEYDILTRTFSPNFKEYEADVRQLNPLLIICCETLIKFIKDFSGHGLPIHLCDEIIKDQQIVFLLEDMHINFLNKRELLFEIDSDLIRK